ncbi:MAG: AAA family ATPase [Ornithinimicrobium sp.]
MTIEADVDELHARLEVVEQRVADLVAARRRKDPEPDDPFRGLYINDETAQRLLDERERGSWSCPPAPDADRTAEGGESGACLARLATAAGLDPLDIDLLLLIALPDLDSRFERLYGYLNDDVTRRRASVGLALEVAGISPLHHAGRRRLSPSGALASADLIVIEDTDRPFLTRGLRLPDRVTSHLLGDKAIDLGLMPFVTPAHPHAGPAARQIGRTMRAGTILLHLREKLPGTAVCVGSAALEHAGTPAIAVDLTRIAREPNPSYLVSLAVREATLAGGSIVAGPVEDLAAACNNALSRLADGRVPVILFGTTTWDPAWTLRPPLSLDVAPLSADERDAVWRTHLGTHDRALSGWGGHLSLGPAQVAQAVHAARASAASEGRDIVPDDLRRGVRGQNAAGLEHLARRVEPEVTWDDLVLAPQVLAALREIAARARHRHTVLTTWRMRRGGGRGIGISAMFAGDSGTGKTMSAEVIAADLDLDLYTVNLATVVDKYVGETEKNLERIFAEAAGVNAVLFFDEADAIFGKRSSVRDAHDRYANIESAYLLQRLESFDGLAILATNLRSNIDDAFTRRLDSIVDFPAPTVDLRRDLWLRCLAPPLPLADDVDLDFCARSFELAGGNIRSACITAAYLAAESGGRVGMAEVVTAVEQEYRKLGRLVLEREFGDYLALFN